MLVHRRIHAWMQNNPSRVDTLFMLSGALFLVLPVLLSGSQRIFLDFLLSLGIVVPAAWRRTRPVLAGSLTAFFCLLQVLICDTPLAADVMALAAVFALAAYAPRWASLGGLGLAVVGGVLFVVRYFGLPLTSPSVELARYALALVAVEAMVLVSWTFGDLARIRRLALQSLKDHTRRLEVERQQERDLAAADERTHIAREMHDIVAHSLSVIVTQADGARYASVQDPEIAARTLETIADTGRGSLREMRRLLGVLRGDELASSRPLPTLRDIATLVDAVRETGLEVTLERSGTMLRPLPAGAELTAYRVIQESLTNIMKHAGPRVRAAVDLAWTAQGLALGVHDDGRGAAAILQPAARSAGPGAGMGRGITGMAERVALYDGRLNAAPAAGGGFRVTAFIPYTEA